MSESGLQTLLRLQQRDNVIDQLSYQRDHLPARAALDDLMAKAGGMRTAMLQAIAERDATAKQTSDVEAEVAKLEARIADINGRLYGAVMVAPKDAEAMSAELGHLKKMKSSQEDAELALMEQIEPQNALVAQFEADGQDLGAKINAAKAEILEGEAEVDEKLSAERSKRQQIVGTVPNDLLVRYDALRPKLGGVAIAAVDGNKCGGCHLSMSSAALDELRKADPEAVITCEECGRMLAH